MANLFLNTAFAQGTEMSITLQPLSSITSNGEVIFPVESQVHQFEAGEGGSFDFASPGGGFVRITFFIGTTEVTLDFFIDSYDQSAVIASRPLPSGRNVVGSFIYDMKTFERSTESLTFENPFAMTVGYTDAQIENLNEETLNIYFWNESKNIWETFASSTLNTADNTVTILTDHLTLFATLGAFKEAPQATKAATVSISRGGGSPLLATGGGGLILQPAPLVTTEPAVEALKEEEPASKKSPLYEEANVPTQARKENTPVPSEDAGRAQENRTPDQLLDIDFNVEARPGTYENSQSGAMILAATAVFAGTVTAIYFFIKRKKYFQK